MLIFSPKVITHIYSPCILPFTTINVNLFEHIDSVKLSNIYSVNSHILNKYYITWINIAYYNYTPIRYAKTAVSDRSLLWCV